MPGIYFSQKLARVSAWLCSGIVLAFIAGCSGTTPSSSTTTPPSTGTAAAATIQLSVSSSQLLTSSVSTSVLTATVLDANGQAISGTTVTFSAGGDPTAYFTNVNATTGSNGTATATLNLGTDMENRTITMSALDGSAKGTAAISVTGTTISISGNNSLALNASTALTISVKNASGVAVPGETLTVTSANGNTISKAPTTGVTDVNGQIVATLTAISATSPDVITVTMPGGTQKTQSLTINNTNFVFTAPVTVPPAATPEILVNTPTPVSILWMGVADGTIVRFCSTRGLINSVVGCNTSTTTAGAATVNVNADTTGAATLLAESQSGSPLATLNVVFDTNSASSVSVVATPSTVAANPVGSTANQSLIAVVVRDSSNNLVNNATVAFTLISDPSSGSLSSPIATTNISGSAAVNYIPGSAVSAPNQEQITATVVAINGVQITPVTGTTSFTVASPAFHMVLGYDNLVSVSGQLFSKIYTALVTDSAGNPAPDGTPVTFSLNPPPNTGAGAQPTAFMKGFYSINTTTNQWGQTITASCPSEDVNGTGIYLASEDLNNNNHLDPEGVAQALKTNVTNGGIATTTVTYPQNYANWVVMTLQATAGLGNEPPTAITVVLPGLTSDYTNATQQPPDWLSPYGVDSSCNDTN